MGSFRDYFQKVKEAQELNKKVCGNCYNYDYDGYADIYRQRTRLCDRCGKPFAPGSNRQKYCPECGRSIRRKQKADSARRRRSVEH